MKTNRHETILELVKQYPINTQEELIEHLRAAGFEVTQSTVSRDIKQLRLTKTLMPDGKYRYRPADASKSVMQDNFSQLFRNSVLSARHANNLVVVKTYSGMAQAACAALDSMGLEKVVGTLAGDDTFFAACEDDLSAQHVAAELSKYIR